jgi:hypothetical protein
MSSQVKRKAAEADEMIRQMAAAAEAGVSDNQEPEANAQPETAEVVAIQPNDSQNDSETDVISEQSVSETRYSDDEIAELQEAARKADARWRSLQGQIDSKDRQIEQLHSLLSNMQSAAPAETAESSQGTAAGYTKEDADNFGDDLIDLVSRVARQVAGEVAQSQVQPLQKELETVSSFTASSVQESFESKLDKTSSNWRALNEDTKFIDWLQESETRLNGFRNAAAAKDAIGTADYFNMYSKLFGLDVDKAADKQRKLEKQLAPGKARSTATTASSTPEGKNWTRSEIAAFYTNKGSMPADEFAKTERAIAKAMSEDRVDYTK